MTGDDEVKLPAGASRATSPEVCPDPERLAAWIDGGLPAADRARVDLHLARCADCREIVAETVRFHETESSSSSLTPLRARARRRPILIGAGAVLATAAALLLAVWVVRPGWATRWFGPASSRPELAELVAAVGDRRPIEPRLSGGFAYGPPPSPMRGGTGPEVPPDVRIAAARIEKLAQASESAVNEDALGVAYLMSGDIDRSVSLLEDAVDQQPGNGDFQNDLAAAYLAQAKRFDRAEDYPKALAAAERAIKADPSLTEAWFNRALALEALYLTEEARKAWNDYLSRDSTSPWAEEARKHLSALPADTHHNAWDDARPGLLTALDADDRAAISRTVDRFGQDTREAVENDFLPRWGDAIVSNDRAEAARWLTRAERLATAIVAQHHDKLPIDAVTYARRHASQSSVARDLAKGYQAYRAALKEYYNDEFDHAAASFASANADFSRTRTPSVLWTRYWLGVADFHRNQHPAALGTFKQLRVIGRTPGYTNLAAFSDWTAGLTNAIDGSIPESLSLYHESAQLFSDTCEDGNLTQISALIAESEDFAGDVTHAWTDRLYALKAALRTANARLRHGVYSDATWAALHEDVPEAALYFQNTVVAEAAYWGTAVVKAEVLIHRAEIENRLGESPAARADLDRAQTAVANIDSPAYSWPLKSDLAMQRAVAAADPQAAIEDAKHGLVYAQHVGVDYRMMALRLELARAYRRARKPDAARDTLLAGIEAFEHASVPQGAEQRAEYLDQSWHLFGNLLNIEAEGGRADRALAVAELGHARPSPHASPESALADLARLRTLLPGTARMLYYASLDRRTVGWVVSNDRESMFSVPIDHDHLRQLVSRFTEAVQASDLRRTHRLATQLYDYLIEPSLPLLANASRLVIVPGDVLEALPFSALIDPRSDHFLVQDFAIQITPSAAAFNRAVPKEHPVASLAAGTVLAVGNPAIDRSVFAGMPSLPDSAAEARAIGRAFPNAEVLVGAAATRSAFLERARYATLIHFGGHAIVNARYPSLSQLLLAPDTSGGTIDNGAVLVRDIEHLRLSAARLVVLAACGAAAGAPYRGEGVLSLARAWMEAGARAVVGTLWAVRDQATARLFEKFYAAFKASGDPATSLRDAQMAMIESPNPVLNTPSSWAGVVLYGSTGSPVHSATRSTARRTK